MADSSLSGDVKPKPGGDKSRRPSRRNQRSYAEVLGSPPKAKKGIKPKQRAPRLDGLTANAADAIANTRAPLPADWASWTRQHQRNWLRRQRRRLNKVPVAVSDAKRKRNARQAYRKRQAKRSPLADSGKSKPPAVKQGKAGKPANKLTVHQARKAKPKAPRKKGADKVAERERADNYRRHKEVAKLVSEKHVALEEMSVVHSGGIFVPSVPNSKRFLQLVPSTVTVSSETISDCTTIAGLMYVGVRLAEKSLDRGTPVVTVGCDPTWGSEMHHCQPVTDVAWRVPGSAAGTTCNCVELPCSHFTDAATIIVGPGYVGDVKQLAKRNRVILIYLGGAKVTVNPAPKKKGYLVSVEGESGVFVRQPRWKPSKSLFRSGAASYGAIRIATFGKLRPPVAVAMPGFALAWVAALERWPSLIEFDLLGWLSSIFRLGPEVDAHEGIAMLGGDHPVPKGICDEVELAALGRPQDALTAALQARTAVRLTLEGVNPTLMGSAATATAAYYYAARRAAIRSSRWFGYHRATAALPYLGIGAAVVGGVAVSYLLRPGVQLQRTHAYVSQADQVRSIAFYTLVRGLVRTLPDSTRLLSPVFGGVSVWMLTGNGPTAVLEAFTEYALCHVGAWFAFFANVVGGVHVLSSQGIDVTAQAAAMCPRSFLVRIAELSKGLGGLGVPLCRAVNYVLDLQLRAHGIDSV